MVEAIFTRKFQHLLSDDSMRRWFENLQRGSIITAEVYLRSVGNFCGANGVSPRELAKVKEKKLYEMLLDLVGFMERKGHAGGYINVTVKSVKNWLVYNHVDLKGEIKIRGLGATPTLDAERVPTREELRRIFLAGDHKCRVACVLVAHAGLRPGVLGNYLGTDALRIGDLPELEIVDGTVSFKEVPTLILVRRALSKAGHGYLTFLGAEGCEYLKAYLELRMRRGERLTSESAVIVPKVANWSMIRTSNIGDVLRLPIRKAGLPWRPYVLRSYFDTQMMMAEAKGWVIRDYRQFFMGHSGDIEAVYTLNKRTLPADVIEQMREGYAKAQKFLQTVETEPVEDVTTAFKRQLLLVAGFKSDEIDDEKLSLADETFQKLVRERLIAGVQNNGARQKVVDLRDVELNLAHGWEFVGALPNKKAILKLPQLA